MNMSTTILPYTLRKNKMEAKDGEKATSNSREESIKRLKPHKNHTSINEHVKAMRQYVRLKDGRRIRYTKQNIKDVRTGEFSEITLRSEDGTIFKAHELVICGQSKFFQKACHPEHFKVSTEAGVQKLYIKLMLLYRKELKITSTWNGAILQSFPYSSSISMCWITTIAPWSRSKDLF